MPALAYSIVDCASLTCAGQRISPFPTWPGWRNAILDFLSPRPSELINAWGSEVPPDPCRSTELLAEKLLAEKRSSALLFRQGQPIAPCPTLSHPTFDPRRRLATGRIMSTRAGVLTSISMVAIAGCGGGGDPTGNGNGGDNGFTATIAGQAWASNGAPYLQLISGSTRDRSSSRGSRLRV